VETWEGGIVRRDRRGRPVYVLYKQVRGRRWKKTLRAKTLLDALVELRRFELDPASYCEPAETLNAPLRLDAALVDAYLASVQNTAKWRAYKRRLLLWWAAKLDGLDLGRVRLATHVLPALTDVRGARHRREAIKALYAWLRKTGRVTLAQDPVAALPVGKGGVAQHTRSKVVPREHVVQVADFLADGGSRYGHALAVQAGTGWHTTEIVRFAANGTIIAPVPEHLAEPGVAAILVTPIAKNGRRHYAKVTSRVAFAARLLVGQGISERHYYAAVKRACRELRVAVFSPAWMRHTNATHALQAGATEKDAGRFLGHAPDGRMVREVYALGAVPPKVPTVL
jgi:integrase